MVDQALLFELKQLYVAVTRARSNLWIYDQSERGEIVRLGLQNRRLVTTLGPAANGEVSIPLARKSTPQEWLEAGLRFMTAEDYEVSKTLDSSAQQSLNPFALLCSKR
jgi:ATP-dependent exoDNAse (exonuclease V) beta subunit